MDPADLSDLYNRRVTTRELAKKYGTTEKWMSQTFSGKVRVAKASQRKAARNAFREFHAQQVVAGQVNIYQAAEAAYTSYSTMRRVVLRLLKRERLT
jgi:hypothetical protein